ncbi:MAG: DUF2726 domain-containing protein [Clostridiales bacterium]|jgi:hypothetical protein|nr:DUF2726 domain-containing protein [Clostridiales bacterium]
MSIHSPKKVILRALICIAFLLLSLFFVYRNVLAVIAICFIIIICIAIILVVLYRHYQKIWSAPPPQYKKKTTVVSVVEQKFYQILLKACPKYTVLQQVPLSSVIEKCTSNAYRSELFRVIDYCLVDSQTYQPKLLIELNDASHKRADRVLRDQKVKAICDIAGLNIISFENGTEYTVKDIAKAVKRALKK